MFLKLQHLSFANHNYPVHATGVGISQKFCKKNIHELKFQISLREKFSIKIIIDTYTVFIDWEGEGNLFQTRNYEQRRTEN